MTRDEFLYNNTTIVVSNGWYKPKVSTEYTEPLFNCPKCGGDVRRLRKRGKIDKDGEIVYKYECDFCEYVEWIGVCEN